MRRLLLGDWSRWVRDPIDLLRLTFPLGAVGYAVLEGGQGVMAMVVATVAVFVARAVDLPRLYDLAFCVAMVFTGWGEAAGWYDAWPPYDNVVHTVVPLLTSQVAYLALARLEVLPDPRDELGDLHRNWFLFTVTLCLGATIGAVWEVFEWTSDGVLGSDLSLGNEDTVTDLISDTAGSALGGLGLVLWMDRGWGSVRRIPGENRYEDTDA